MIDVKIIFRINPFKQHYFAQSRSARGKKIPASPRDKKVRQVVSFADTAVKFYFKLINRQCNKDQLNVGKSQGFCCFEQFLDIYWMVRWVTNASGVMVSSESND